MVCLSFSVCFLLDDKRNKTKQTKKNKNNKSKIYLYRFYYLIKYDYYLYNLTIFIYIHIRSCQFDTSLTFYNIILYKFAFSIYIINVKQEKYIRNASKQNNKNKIPIKKQYKVKQHNFRFIYTI